MLKCLLLLVLALLPSFGNPAWGQAPTVRVDASEKQPHNGTASGQDAKGRDAVDNPIVADSTGRHQADIERKEGENQAAEAKADEQYHHNIDRWTLRWNAITAIATAILILIGFGGVLAAIQTLKAINRQAHIANKTLIAQFRPRVVVRRIGLYNEAGNWGIRLLVVNIGGTNATIRDGWIDIQWRVGGEPRYQALHQGRIEGFSLGAGEEQSFNIAISDNSRFESKMHVFRLALSEGRPNKYSMQAVGEIGYVDDSGAGKKTGFFRILDIQSLRFGASQNTEDEYQD
jgi:hypothetical protein